MNKYKITEKAIEFETADGKIKSWGRRRGAKHWEKVGIKDEQIDKIKKLGNELKADVIDERKNIQKEQKPKGTQL